MMETSRITQRCWTLTFRRVKDLVLNRTLVLYRWLPFVLYFPIIVYSSLCFGTMGTVGSVSNTRLLGSSRHADLQDGRSLCEHAGWQTEDGYKFRDVEKDRPSGDQTWLDHPVVLMFFPVWLSIYGRCMRMSCLILGGVMSCFVFSFRNKLDFTSNKQWDAWEM